MDKNYATINRNRRNKCGESGGVLKAAENTAVTVLFYSLECLHFVEDATGFLSNPGGIGDHIIGDLDPVHLC